ncbi:MAG: V-type ATP synthase subunit A, partial [Firmicutes bacterium]|nr:V-type ATP synthase subunit A [Bacillota bacterium]
MAIRYTIQGINGPVVTVQGGRSLPMMSLVYVGGLRLPGEVVSSRGETSVIQVYEDTAGLKTGETVDPTGGPLKVRLGPGMIGNIYDGIARPLRQIESMAGPFIARGITLPALDEERFWDVTMHLKEGDSVRGGQIFARVSETPAVEHRALVPPGVAGRVKDVVLSGGYKVLETLAVVVGEDGSETNLTLSQEWPIRRARPYEQRIPIDRPLVTGQRVIDTLFPVGKGGCAAIPGPFGAG